jgi:hypothetical protein
MRKETWVHSFVSFLLVFLHSLLSYRLKGFKTLTTCSLSSQIHDKESSIIATCFIKTKLATWLCPSSKVCLVNKGSTSISTSQDISDSNSLAQLCAILSSACSTISSVAILAKADMVSSRISSLPDMPTIRIDNVRNGSALHSNSGVITPRSA